jgi:hypothetical protein
VLTRVSFADGVAVNEYSDNRSLESLIQYVEERIEEYNAKKQRTKEQE